MSGAIYTLGGAIIGWSSKTQRTTTISSTEAEYVAMSSANQELLFMQNLMGKLGVAVQPRLLFNNNQGAIALVKNRQVGQQTKHIDIRHHFIWDTWESGKMDVRFVGTLENEADICTKNLEGPDHTKFRERLRAGTLGVWLNYQSMTDPMPRREDVKQLKRVATLVQSIESVINW